MKNEQPKIAFIEKVKATMAIKIKKGDAYYLHIEASKNLPCVFLGYISITGWYEFLVLDIENPYSIWAKPEDIEKGQLLDNVYPNQYHMEIPELLNKLNDLEDESNGDCESAHEKADKLLLKYINNAEISSAFHKIKRWYS